MDYAVDTVQSPFQPGSSRKINTGTTACRGHRRAAPLESPNHFGTQRPAASGHHDLHRARIVLLILSARQGGHGGGRESRSGAQRVPRVDT